MSKKNDPVDSGLLVNETAETKTPEKGSDITTLSADTREQLQEDALKYLADNPGSYPLGAAGYNAEIGKHTLKIKNKEK